jgi:hypothetical protein
MQTVRLLAILLGAVALLNLAPVVWCRHFNLETAPGWARAVVLIAALQVLYTVWLLATPDWSTLRVLMMLLALTAAIYGMAAGITLATPLDKPMPFGLGKHRHSAPRWCAAVLLFTVLATYLCGRISTRWRRSLELEMAGHGKASGGQNVPPRRRQ